MKCLGCQIKLEKTIEALNNKDIFLGDIEQPDRFLFQYLWTEEQDIIDLCQEKKPKRVLDVGCGTGRLIKIVQAYSETPTESGFEWHNYSETKVGFERQWTCPLRSHRQEEERVGSPLSGWPIGCRRRRGNRIHPGPG